ncbi:MAG: DMT family transporter [Muribaculaceae bacterium]|nr:DMT family transporter [Muribaculaceae bacterium]
MRQSGKPVILGAVAVLSWSTVATAFKIALSHLSTFEMVFVATLTALVIFTVWMTVTGSWKELRGLTPSLWGRFALLGFISPVAYYLILFKAYDYLPAQIAQPVNYLWPILLTVMLAVISRKPIPGAKYIGMAVSLAGVAAISIGGKGIAGSVSVTGLLLGLGSAFLWALYWIVNDGLKDKVGEATSLFLTFLFGMVYLLAGTLVAPLSPMNMEAILSGAYIGAFEMGVPFICFGMAIRHTDNPALINQMCYLSPFLSLFFISLILGEPIMPTTYIGLALIVGGLAYNQYFAGRRDVRRAA